MPDDGFICFNRGTFIPVSVYSKNDFKKDPML